MAMRIEAVTHLTAEIHEALGRLLPQLNAKLGVPDADRMRRMLDDPDVVLLIAREGERIVGTTTVVVYTTPFWIKARLDEVVVDQSARRKGVGEALVKAALDVGRERGAQVAELQSGRGPTHEAAHRLYERIGFQVRDTDVFRISLSPSGTTGSSTSSAAWRNTNAGCGDSRSAIIDGAGSAPCSVACGLAAASR